MPDPEPNKPRHRRCRELVRRRAAIPIARSIFVLIIFLTGCAPKGYYTEEAAHVPATGVQSAGFVWPLQGNIESRFGSRPQGVTLKGIVIRAPKGAKVIAAKEGRVSFIDPSLPGYGKTLILEHSKEFSTVYAGNSEILVRLGQWVRQGDVVAAAGSSDGGSRLYFEVRKNSKAEDPLAYLTQR